MRMKAYDKIVDNSKRLTQMHQFRAEPINLMLACLAGGGIKAHLAWQNLQIQKFLHRELRIHNDAVSGRKMHYHVGAVRWSVVVKTGLSHRLGDVVEDDDEPGDGDDEDADEGSGAESAPPVALPKKPPANFNALYGQHMLGSRGHQSSLCPFAFSSSRTSAHVISLPIQSIRIRSARSFHLPVNSSSIPGAHIESAGG